RSALVAGGGLAVAALAAALIVSGRETGDPPSTTTTATTSACTPLPYQPCGQAAAPNTDGQRCLTDFADYDADAGNGCEAAPDTFTDGDALVDRIEASIVPTDDVDTFTLDVADGRQLLCDGRLVVTLTAPAGVSLRLELIEGEEVLGQATSADGVPAAVSLREPECLFDDSTTLTARVSPIGSDRSAEAYVLERAGSF
ncbi:MAG TPA: hypothetical protein VIR58_08555, partial [Acidimicrobiales bacterium]